MNIGAVAALRNIKDAISVARHVLENTKHTMLVGEQATAFAVQMGYKQESLSTEKSQHMWTNWKNNRCQPNFWMVSAKPNFYTLASNLCCFFFRTSALHPR
jgi:N4-(beta-N-acetylglucosaminyl)-L-asparaginase